MLSRYVSPGEVLGKILRRQRVLAGHSSEEEFVAKMGDGKLEVRVVRDVEGGDAHKHPPSKVRDVCDALPLNFDNRMHTATLLSQVHGGKKSRFTRAVSHKQSPSTRR